MSFRFRRSIRLGKGVRLNLSKSGLGLSFGVRGARFGIGPRGTRTSVGIPGTGLYWEERSRHRRRKVASLGSTDTDSSLGGCLATLLAGIGLLIFLAAPSAGVGVLLVGAIIGLLWFLNRPEDSPGDHTLSPGEHLLAEEVREASAFGGEKERQSQIDELTKAAEKRQAELQRRAEMDMAMMRQVLDRPFCPLGQSPIPLGKDETPCYMVDGALAEPRANGLKTIDRGTILVTTRKVYLLGANQTISFGLNKVISLDGCPGYVDIARGDRARHQHFVTEWPCVLTAHIVRAMQAAGIRVNADQLRSHSDQEAPDTEQS